MLEIRPAGPGSALLARGRLSTGVGKHWLLLGAQPYAKRYARSNAVA
jgi:hypothetical protein